MAVRPLAAVELWINVAQSEHDETKNRMPEITLNDPSKLVRHTEARVVAAINAIETPLQQWNELLPLTSRCCTSQQVHERELGIFVLSTVFKNIVEGFSQHMQELLASSSLSFRIQRAPRSV